MRPLGESKNLNYTFSIPKWTISYSLKISIIKASQHTAPSSSANLSFTFVDRRRFHDI